MLCVAAPPPPAWDRLLPAAVRRLSAELATVDADLDDDRFITPGSHLLHPAWSPVGPDPDPAAPAVLETPLPARLPDALPGGQRLDLVAAVLPHRPGPAGSPPHHAGQAGRPRRPRVIEQRNVALLAKLAGDKLLRCHKLRIDTTVVGANVAYPTDLGLLARAVSKLVTTAKRVQAAGGATPTRVRDRRRVARRRAREVARAMRSPTGDAKQIVFAVTRQVAALAEAQLADARRVVANTRRALRRSAGAAGRCAVVADEPKTTIARTRRLLDQAATRLAAGSRTGQAGWSARTIPTPVRSARAASATQSSSATRPKSPTTPTGSSSTTPSCSPTHPTRRCWSRGQAGRRPDRQGARGAHRRPWLR